MVSWGCIFGSQVSAVGSQVRAFRLRCGCRDYFLPPATWGRHPPPENDCSLRLSYPCPQPYPYPFAIVSAPILRQGNPIGIHRPSSVICPLSSVIFSTPLSLRCLITAGPTREFFDPVRFISNPSTGKMGFALAAAAQEAGWSVDLVAGPVSLPEPAGVMVYPVVTAAEMLRQTDALFEPCDILIMTAAVSDWRPKVTHAQKLKKNGEGLTVEMEPVPDILTTLAENRRTDQFIVAFAAETENIEANALDKLERKGADLIAANSVVGPEGAFGSDENKLILLGRNGFREVLGPGPKSAVARQLIEHIARQIKARAV